MDDQRRPRPDDTPPADPGEGVRIIGPDEAAEAMERGDIASRRGDDQLRFGDRPDSPPVGPRPSLRFPLDASADPTRIERPPVQPAPDPVTGPVEMPHWTDPPTGEVPAVLIGDESPLMEDGEDLDAWSSFATSTPRWRDADDDWDDDDFMEKLADSEEVRMGALHDSRGEPGRDFGFDDLEERVEERRGETADPDAGDEVAADDWSASETEPGENEVWAEEEEWDDDGFDDGPYQSDGPDDPAPATPATVSGGGERDMGSAVLVGGGLGVLAIALLFFFPTGMVVLIAAALGLAAIEYFGVLRKVGWEAATPLGVAACTLLPLAVYWRGTVAFPLIGFLVVVAVLSWYLVGAGGPDPRVLEGSGATILGIAWIGGLGATTTAMLRVGDEGAQLLFVALLATVAYDVGGLFTGRAMGSRPLSAASPNKTFEGLLGGMGAALVVTLVCVALFEMGLETGAAAGIILGVGAAVAAPLGDLCQSLLKRDLGVKDMGTVLPGHGGMLDRIDGMLFVVPVLYWLTVSLV